MGIFGNFRVEKPKQTLRNIKMGTGGYIFCSDFILSKSLLCISLDTEVYYAIEDIKELDFDNYVAIHKLDNKLQQNSFSINLKEDPDFDTRDWYLSPESVTQNYLESNDWICFENPPIFFDEISSIEEVRQNMDQIDTDLQETETIITPVVISNLSSKELHQKLNQAITKEDYELAAKIRDEISRKKEKPKE